MSTSDPSLRDQGIEALRERDFDRAIDLLARAVIADDADVDARALLGVAYSQKGLHTQAKQALQAAVELQPRNANFRFNLGVALERAGDLPAAAAAYRETLQLNKDHAQARAKLQAIGPQASAAPDAPRPSDAGGITAAGPPPVAPAGLPPRGAPPDLPPPAPPQYGRQTVTPGPPDPAGSPPAPQYGRPSTGVSSGSATQGDAGAGPRYAPLPPQYSPPPAAGVPGYAPAGAAGPGYPPGMSPPSAPPPAQSATVRCPRCAQWTRPGLACQWCAAPLPAFQPAPAVQPGTGVQPVYSYGAAFKTPHRGGLILALGILSFFVCAPLAIAAWVMGNKDLADMDAGIMDDSGRANTQAGRIAGIVVTVLWVIQMLVVVGFVIFMIATGMK